MVGEHGESLVEIKDVTQPSYLVMGKDDELSWKIGTVVEVLSKQNTLGLC